MIGVGDVRSQRWSSTQNDAPSSAATSWTFDRAPAGPSSTVPAGTEPDAGLVGTVIVGHDGHRGRLYYLAVDPGRRGEGFGRALVTAAEARAAVSVPKVQLMVREDNTVAVAFHERLGCECSRVTVLGRRLG